uniref:Uncharacterized protein n=1 Tax=viral metagenome TaxID=1070528 RepID=A0A6C0I5R3_9ZZZZ
MQYAVGVGTAVCCFAAAYGAHMVFPTKPIAEGDILLSQSTLNTLNFLPIEKLREMKLTPRKLCQLYLDKRANLADVLMIVTNKSTFDEALKFLQTQTQTPENMFLMRAVHDHYPTKELPGFAVFAPTSMFSAPAATSPPQI